MTETTKTLLIVGGVALVGYLIYKRVSVGNAPSAFVTPTSGAGQTVSGATHQGAQGATSFWDTLGSAGKGLNAAVSSVESTYNNVYDLFGGNSTSTNTGQGNNGTLG